MNKLRLIANRESYIRAGLAIGTVAVPTIIARDDLEREQLVKLLKDPVVHCAISEDDGESWQKLTQADCDEVVATMPEDFMLEPNDGPDGDRTDGSADKDDKTSNSAGPLSQDNQQNVGGADASAIVDAGAGEGTAVSSEVATKDVATSSPAPTSAALGDGDNAAPAKATAAPSPSPTETVKTAPKKEAPKKPAAKKAAPKKPVAKSAS